eukprot:GHVT01073978.1.p1 GENE.GHVT01073978.1~~GHVT01073978.1.p1  ORF type:complete len:149 (+),score=42.47 GHVT01073978.1:301-747(+)
MQGGQEAEPSEMANGVAVADVEEEGTEGGEEAEEAEDAEEEEGTEGGEEAEEAEEGGRKASSSVPASSSTSTGAASTPIPPARLIFSFAPSWAWPVGNPPTTAFAVSTIESSIGYSLPAGGEPPPQRAHTVRNQSGPSVATPFNAFLL